VLAGEANEPGSFSRRTVNLLADLDKGDAELFVRLCSFDWLIGTLSPLVFEVNDAIYNRFNIDFSSLSHLESLGLVQFNNLTGFLRVQLPKSFAVSYYGRSVELTLPQDSSNQLDVGKVLLTKAGQELAPICGSKPVEGFFDFVYDRWVAGSLVPPRSSAATGSDLSS
jgi:hypothetical protein